MAQQQVLEHEVAARPYPGQDRRDQQPDEVEHVLSIADLRPHDVLPPHNTRPPSINCDEMRAANTRIGIVGGKSRPVVISAGTASQDRTNVSRATGERLSW